MDKVLGALISLWLAFSGHAHALQLGAQGPQVKAVQKALSAEGFSPHGVDGVYGPQTDQAVRRFERAEGLSVDGLAGSNVVLNLIRPEVSGKVLRTGTSGMPVKLLQEELKGSGLAVGQVDGVFGPKTEAAVRTFQRTHHLSVDGVVGPKTWSALLAPTVVVQAGDTLAKIAERYGVSVDAMIKVNQLSHPNVLQIGETLRLPGKGVAVSQTPAPAKTPPATPAAQPKGGQVPSAVSKAPPKKWGGAGTPRIALAFYGLPTAAETSSLDKAGIPVTVFYSGVPAKAPGAPVDAEIDYLSQSELSSVLGALSSAGPKLAYVPRETASALSQVMQAKLLPLVHVRVAATAQAAGTNVVGGQVIVMPATQNNLSAFPALTKKLQAEGFTLVTARMLVGAS